MRVEAAADHKQARINKQNNKDTASLKLIYNITNHSVNLNTS